MNYNRLPNNGVGSAEDSKILQRFNENYTGTEIMNVNFTILPHFCHVVVDLDVGDALLVDINVAQVSNVADLVAMDLMMMEVTRIYSKSKKWTLCQRLIIMIMIIIINIIMIIMTIIIMIIITIIIMVIMVIIIIIIIRNPIQAPVREWFTLDTLDSCLVLSLTNTTTSTLFHLAQGQMMIMMPVMMTMRPHHQERHG